MEFPELAGIIGRGPLGPEQLRHVHDATLEVLSRTGLRIDCTDYHGPLESAGAGVDRNTCVVKFPGDLVEGTIEFLNGQVASGRRQYILNGVINSRWTPPNGCKFGGACIEYLDLDAGEIRPPTEHDLVRLLQLGESLDSVGFVGNPVTCLLDAAGEGVPGPMQRIKTAAVVAKHTRKCGSTEVWNEQELEFLIEIGCIARGSEEEFYRRPCFVTAKETIAPLRFPEEDGRILLMLARRGLPCTIVPMPIAGSTSPCTAAANVVMTNAEILGVMTALHAVEPSAIVGAGIISGTTDMTTGLACFASPEAAMQEVAVAELYDQVYGLDLGMGTGYIDAKYPGAQSLAEKSMKMFAAARHGRFNFPVGLLAGGKRFCPVTAMLELELAEAILRMVGGMPVTPETLAVDVIDQVGIGGEFLSHEHTLEHFRTALWSPQLIDRRNPETLEVDTEKDMIEVAKEKVREIWKQDDLYTIDDDRGAAIDDVVARAERVLK